MPRGKHEPGIMLGVVAPREGHPLAAKQWNDDLQRLLEPGNPMIPREPERVVLRIVPSRPESEDQPAVADLVGGDGHLRHESRTAEARAQHEGPDLDPFRGRREGAHDRPGLVHPLDRPVLGLIEEMVEHPHRIEPTRLSGSGEGSDRRPPGRLAPAARLGGGKDHADLHGAESRCE